MDNLTHTLAGIALAQAGLKRKTRFAMLGLIIASNIPDADVVMAVGGRLDYLKYHRGITHSLIGLTAIAAIVAIIVYLLRRRARPRKNAPPLRLKWLFLVCWIGTACHVLMDYTNSYGIRPFLPFSGRWVALNIMPIIGPWLLAVLILGLCVPVVLGLVTEEQGARRGVSHAARNGAVFSLCAMVALWGLRGLARQKAMGLLSAHDYGGEIPGRLGAFPTALNPFAWNGVAETGGAYYLLRVSALASNAPVEDAEVLRKPPASAALDAAESSSAAKIFLNFARFPYATVFTEDTGEQVIIRDLRFASTGSQSWNFVLQISLNRSMHITQQTFSFSIPRPTG